MGRRTDMAAQVDDPGSVPGSVPDQVTDLLALVARAPEVDLARGLGPLLGPGARLGRFVLAHELGRGSTGVVYEALDTERRRRVAVKVLAAGPAGAPRGAAWARCEAAALARLDHPNIVTLLGVGTSRGVAHLVFELLDGRSLDRRQLDGPVAPAGVLAIGIGAARALVHAHAAGQVHRALDPSKIFLCDDGTVKLLDFSPARRFPSNASASPPGRPYRAPEQLDGWPGDERSDLYALAAILEATLVRGGPQLLELAPPHLRELLAAALARTPAERPPSAQAFLDRLLQVRAPRVARWSWTGLKAAVLGPPSP
jgi:serine/threonine protein kinase